jgi:hypothetical protein
MNIVPMSQLAVVSVAEVARPEAVIDVEVDKRYEGRSDEAPRGYVSSMATGRTD